MFQFGSPLSLTRVGKPTILRKTRDINMVGIIDFSLSTELFPVLKLGFSCSSPIA
jgi:hypothetical protein